MARPTRYNKEKLVQILVAWRNKHGRIPRTIDINADSSSPHAQTFVNRFGSWKNALKWAGMPMVRGSQIQYSDEDLLRILVEFRNKYGRSPMTKDINADSSSAHAQTFVNRFGSWNKALKAAGLPLHRRKKHPEIIICEICGLEKPYYAKNLCQACYCGILYPTKMAGFPRYKVPNVENTYIFQMQRGKRLIWMLQKNGRKRVIGDKLPRSIDVNNLIDMRKLEAREKLRSGGRSRRTEIDMAKKHGKYWFIIKRGERQAKELYTENQNECYLTCQPTRLILYYFFASKNLPYELYEKCNTILLQLSKKTCWNRSKISLAAGLIYFCCSDILTHPEISDELGVSPATTRNTIIRLKSILRELDLEEKTLFITKTKKRGGIASMAIKSEKLIKVTFDKFDFNKRKHRILYFSAKKTATENYESDSKKKNRLVLWYTEETLAEYAEVINAHGGIINPEQHNL